MMSLLMTLQIRFEVFRKAGKTLMGIFLDYTCFTHVVQSICNISEIANMKTHLQFENIYGGGSHHFWAEQSLKFTMSYLFYFLRYGQMVFSF